MNEKVLHFIWKYQLFSDISLETTQNESLIILNAGLLNDNSGPDFLTASVRINDQLWVGNVEIHQKSSDWYLHNHHIDEHYKAVILHVVWEHDREVFNPHQQIIPTFELSKFVKSDFLKRYTGFNSNNPKWILCENELKNISKFTLQNWMEVLFLERLERKSVEINQLLLNYKNDWEAVLWVLLCKNFGAKINSEAFLQLAQSVDFQIIRKEKNNLLVLEALLFGQAGFLINDIEDAYYQKLQNEYQYLISKYSLTTLSSSTFHFFRLRPLNFPTIRIAQLAGVIYATQSLFSKLMETTTKDEIYAVFTTQTSAYWDTHYTFGKESKSNKKRISKAFVDTLMINTVIPLKFAYSTKKGTELIEHLLELMESVKAEKNAIIDKFSQFGIIAVNAIQTQSMLELKNEYCLKIRCLDCSIGNEILRKSI
ncbi:MAG: DUF2851 family protein [Flavobacteriaceae bacterium]|nr:DUF2851 family protein [Flavobacteriaceae bacterium]